MYDWIVETIDAGRPLPDDAAICERFGFTSTEAARTLLASLADAGLVTIRGWGADRSITLGRARSQSQAACRETDTAAAVAAILARRRAAAPMAAVATRSMAAFLTSAPERNEPGTDTVNISIHLRSETCASVRALATTGQTSLTKVAVQLIEEALAFRAGPTATSALPLDIVSLTAVPTEWLIDEIGRRLAEAGPAAERDAAVARAEAAEGQLAALRTQVRALVGEG